MDLAGLLSGLSKLEPPKTWTDLFIIVGVVIAATVAITQAVNWAYGKLRATHTVEDGPKPSGREFVPPGVTWEFLTGLCKGHTQVASDRLLKPYLGKWFKAEGELAELREFNSEYAAHMYLPPEYPYRLIALTFDKKKWKGKVDVLPKGGPISVVGRIRFVLEGSMSLEDCELVDTSG